MIRDWANSHGGIISIYHNLLNETGNNIFYWFINDQLKPD